ncbi:MAG: class I SAM-dependent DNA methyltransferase [Phycisphaerales bacterium]
MADASNSNSDLAYADTLWKSADALRGQIDAAEYKHVVLGLLFLKYISDAFAATREKLKADLEKEGIAGKQAESLLETRDEYTAERIFWVPPEARWDNLQNQATRADIATLIDDAILAVERDNSGLKGKLPRDYARRGIAPEKMKGLIDLIANIGFMGDRDKARDTLGRVYEYFLGKFAQAEGKLGGEFFTPRCVVRLLVEMLEPYEGRVYDPCCGSAGMFVQSERFVEAHGGRRTDISIFGQESNPTTWRLAHMNLAIRGIEANLGSQPADSFLRDLHPDLKADYILANPPFNVSDWSGQLLRDDVRWRYGTPPTGNANYAWIQHFIHHLAPPNGRGGGVAGFVMANGSLSSGSGGEGEIRQRIVEADLVDCIVALPAQLFLTTGIPACLWFLSRNKTGKNLPKGGRDRSGETLFINAQQLGTMQTRTLRVLSGGDDGETMLADSKGDPYHDTDIGRIVYAFRQWRGEPAPEWWDAKTHGEWAYRNIPGFCKSAKTEEIAKHGFVLTPGRYVGAEELEDDGEPFEEKYPRLLAELEDCFGESDRLTNSIREALARVDHGG